MNGTQKGKGSNIKVQNILQSQNSMAISQLPYALVSNSFIVSVMGMELTTHSWKQIFPNYQIILHYLCSTLEISWILGSKLCIMGTSSSLNKHMCEMMTKQPCDYKARYKNLLTLHSSPTSPDTNWAVMKTLWTQWLVQTAWI